MEQGAADTGNINSSRTGISEGLVRQGLAEQASGLGAQLTGNAYTHGLDLASNTNATNNAANLNAYNAEAGAGNAATNTGLDAYGNSISNQGNLFNLAGSGGAGLQSGNQAADTNAAQMYQASQTNPFLALNNYYNLIGGQNWGTNTTGTGTSTTTKTPSMLDYISGGLGAVGSLAKGFSGFTMPNFNTPGS
jgi:hypothetical protein